MRSGLERLSKILPRPNLMGMGSVRKGVAHLVTRGYPSMASRGCARVSLAHRLPGGMQAQGMTTRSMQAGVSCSGGRTTACDPRDVTRTLSKMHKDGIVTSTRTCVPRKQEKNDCVNSTDLAEKEGMSLITDIIKSQDCILADFTEQLSPTADGLGPVPNSIATTCRVLSRANSSDTRCDAYCDQLSTSSDERACDSCTSSNRHSQS